MKRNNIFRIIWIFVILELQDVNCVSYPGVYRNELPVIIPGASPIENVFVTERYGLNYECIETCYPILNVCGDICSIRPELPECAQCHQLPAAQPTPIIIETPPYEPRPPAFEGAVEQHFHQPSRLLPLAQIPEPIRPSAPRPNFRPSPRPIMPQIPRTPQFESVLPTPVMPDITLPPEPEFLQPDLPPQPILPPVPQPTVFDLIQPESPPQPILYDIPRPLKVEIFETEPPPRPIIPEIPHPPVFEYFQLEFEVTPSPMPILPEQPLKYEPELSPQPILPEPPQAILPEIPLPPQFESIVPPRPIIAEVPRVPQFEPKLPPSLILPDAPDNPQFQLLEPELPYVPMPPQFEYFQPELPPESFLVDSPQPAKIDVFEPPTYDAPSVIIYEPPQVPLIEPLHPEIFPTNFEEIPQFTSPDPNNIIPLLPQYNAENYPIRPFYPETIEVPLAIYDKAGLVIDRENVQPPIVNEYQDICNDYCLLKRNISECEMCLKTGVPADYMELCSNCLVNPSEPDCELCYPILLNLCREFCIFEENEPDCSICYPQPLIQLPEILNKEPVFTTITEYVPPQEVCPEHCVLTPTSAECAGCVIGVEIIEKVCIDICSGYCLENPNDIQCSVCYTTAYPDSVRNNVATVEEVPALDVINYQCCYGEYCTPMPRNGVCPVICKELCTTACSNECFNPTCPDCQEVVALNEHRRNQFMIWLKSKLTDMKSRYMAMIEACIRRTELMYERELQAIEVEFSCGFSTSSIPSQCNPKYENIPLRRIDFVSSGDLKSASETPTKNNSKNINVNLKKSTSMVPPSTYKPQPFTAAHYNYPRNNNLKLQANGRFNINIIKSTAFGINGGHSNKISSTLAGRQRGDFDYIDGIDEFKDLKSFMKSYERVTVKVN